MEAEVEVERQTQMKENGNSVSFAADQEHKRPQHKWHQRNDRSIIQAHTPWPFVTHPPPPLCTVYFIMARLKSLLVQATAFFFPAAQKVIFFHFNLFS